MADLPPSSDLGSSPDATFPARRRLRSNRDYARVMNRQQKAAGRHVVVLALPRPRHLDQRSRLGIMVAVKTVPTAVRRHQLKRWVRELFRTRLQARAHGHDLVVLFRSDLPPDGHALLDQEVLACSDRALAAAPGPRGPRRRR